MELLAGSGYNPQVKRIWKRLGSQLDMARDLFWVKFLKPEFYWHIHQANVGTFCTEQDGDY